MIHKHALLAVACTLSTIGIAGQRWLSTTLNRPHRLQPRHGFDSWKDAITAGSAGMRKPVCPVLVCIDGFKGGTVQPVAWQTAYADKVKELGGSVEIKGYPNDDHFSLPQRCVTDARKWLNALS